MDEYFVRIKEKDEIRQGDIICRDPSKHKSQWGVIITADCDIAQRRSRGNYIWLEIVSNDDYIDGPWATEQIRKFLDKDGIALINQLNDILKKKDSSLTDLTLKSLCEWLETSKPEEILVSMGCSLGNLDKKIVDLHLKLTHFSPNFASKVDPRLRHNPT
jgi:hypothetical protein